MDWNTKWGWENLVNSKTTNNNRKQQTTDWEFEEGILGTGPFRLYEGKNSSSGSAELAPGSSARSSISVCTDSSFKEKTSLLGSGNMNAFCEHDESPPLLESSVGSGESLIGLKLGKRMYFENGLGINAKTVSVPEVRVSSIASNVKKIKSSDLNSTRCQVDGCNLDLSTSKEYHRKHKVCDSHAKCPKVVIGGLERRFCQQCSRFHNLSEFDENKRSCRRRLSDHNARRRKPQLDPMMGLPSPFSAFTYTEGRPQMSFLSSNAQHVYSSSSSNSTWASSFSSKFTTKNGCMLNFGETRDLDEPLQLPSKGTQSEALTRGVKEAVVPSNLDSAPEFHRALSLLSNDSWSSFQPPNNSIGHSVSINGLHHLPSMPGFPHNFPQASSEFCQTDHHLSTNDFAAAANDNNPHFQPFKAPYENVLFSNLYN